MKRELALKQFLMDNVHFIFGIGLCILAFLAAMYAESEDLEVKELIYSDQPLEIRLPVDIPVELRFPEPAEFGIPEELSDFLQIENLAATVFLTAKTSFPSKPVLVKLMHSNVPIVIRLTASMDEYGPYTYLIKTSQRRKPVIPQDALSPVELTRYAAQQLFAPDRLLPKSETIVRVRVSIDPIDLSRDLDIQSHPIASWSSASLYVTAVKLENLSSTTKRLLPQDLRGNWRTATYHHARLQPREKSGDSSVIYLVSDRPFSSALAE